MASNTITKVNAKNCVMDLRDKLNSSKPDEYANMHQVGGKNTGTYPSTIEMVICDYSKGTGDKSVTVSANIEPTLPYEWLEVCKQSLGSVAIPFKERVPKEGGKKWETEIATSEAGAIKMALDSSGRLASFTVALANEAVNLVAKLVKGELIKGSSDLLIGIGKGLKNAREVFKTPTIKNSPYLKVGRGIDYSYVQDKVNIYRKQSDGYAPVSRLTVQRQSFRSDGDAAMYPWTVKITNGEAVVEEKETGASTFKSDTLRNKTEAYIAISDRDMFRMMTRCTHFIDVWENSVCIPLVLEGRAKYEKERQEYIAEKNN